MRRTYSPRQAGVAVVTALLLTTLAMTIVASLFWQQQVQVRSIENQRLQLQKQWILRGVLDWTRLILREDGRYSRVDHLGEPWAVPLAETRLDQYVENQSAAGEVSGAVLSGGVVDAQSRFNLKNLCPDGNINMLEVATFARLLSNARLNPDLALQAANLMARAQPPVLPPGKGNPPPQGRPNANNPNNPNNADNPVTDNQNRPLTILTVDDLLVVPGFTPEALAAVRDFLVVLPRPTPVNVNTAPPAVLAARVDVLTPGDAATLVSSRDRVWFNDVTDFTRRLESMGKQVGETASLSVSTSYFLVNGDVRINRANLQMQALVERNAQATRLIWIRES